MIRQHPLTAGSSSPEARARLAILSGMTDKKRFSLVINQTPATLRAAKKAIDHLLADLIRWPALSSELSAVPGDDVPLDATGLADLVERHQVLPAFQVDHLYARNGFADFTLPLHDELTRTEDQRSIGMAMGMSVNGRQPHDRLAATHLSDKENALLPLEGLAGCLDDVPLGLERRPQEAQFPKRILTWKV